MLLATILARVSKRSFADVMEQEIFAPAKMSSSFVYENHLIPPVKLRTVAAALGYTGPKGQWQVTWGVPPGFRAELLTAGDGAIWSSVADMIRWDRAWREGLFLKAKTVEMMLKEIKTRDGIATGYGLGFALYPNRTGGLYGFGHDGYWGGFRTSYYRHIESNRTTILLSNREDFDMDAFWYKLNAAIDANLPRR
jgi:CubicO group peptidase (beta-lactamase class C family)